MVRKFHPSFMTAGAAFAVAFAAAHLRGAKPGAAENTPPSPAISNSSRGSGQQMSPAADGAVITKTGVLHDAQLSNALANPDLVSAVNDMMLHEQEDHCVDTRLICLVENLPAERLAELAGLLDHFMGNDFVVKFVLGSWAKRDPAGALAWVASRPNLDDTGLRSFIRGWTRGDPQAALAYLERQPASAKTSEWQSAVIEAISEKDAPQAFELMKSKGWLTKNPQAILRLINNWGGTDPSGALEGLRSISTELDLGKQPAERYSETSPFNTLLSSLLKGSFERNPDEARALISQLSPLEIESGKHAITQEVLGRDPAAITALLTGPMDETSRLLAKAVATQAPARALANLDKIQDPALQKEMLLAVGSGSYDQSLPWDVTPQNQQLISGLLAGMTIEERSKVLVTLSAQVARNQSEWAGQLWGGMAENDQLKSNHYFFRDMGAADPQNALAAFRNSSPEVQEKSLKSLCSGLTQSNPVQALDLVLMQTDPGLRAEAAATVFAYWSKDRPEAAYQALEARLSPQDAAEVLKMLPQATSFKWTHGSMFESQSPGDLANRLRTLSGKTAANLSPP